MYEFFVKFINQDYSVFIVADSFLLNDDSIVFIDKDKNNVSYFLRKDVSEIVNISTQRFDNKEDM